MHVHTASALTAVIICLTVLGDQPADAQSANTPASLQMVVERANSVFSSEGGTLAVRYEEYSDKGELVKTEFPLPLRFVANAAGSYEERHISRKTITDSNGRTRTESLDLVTRLQADVQDEKRVLLSEILVDRDGKEGRPFTCEIVLLGEKGIQTKLLTDDLSKAKMGDWVSCDWTRTEAKLLKGVRRYKNSDKVVTWFEEQRGETTAVPKAPTAGLARLGADETTETEVDGSWKLINYLENGKPNEEDIRGGYRIVRKNGVQEITKAGVPFNKRKYEIDPTKMPKQIDFIDEQGTRVRGVYEINGESMRVAILADVEKRKTERPADLQEAGNIIAVYERLPEASIDEQSTAPKTLAVGVARLEEILGRNDVEGDQHEWHIPTDIDYKTRPDPAKAEILSTSTGVWIIGRPLRQPEAVAFDSVMQWKRKVFDLDDNGAKARQTRSQCSHNVTRYSISLRGSEWRVTGTNLSNGVQEIVDTPALLGAVKWHSDGFEFVGSMGLSNYYGAEGNMILGVAYGSHRFSREGKILTIKQRIQPYHPAKAADGTILASPDFAKPIGSLFEQEFKSEPMTGL